MADSKWQIYRAHPDAMRGRYRIGGPYPMAADSLHELAAKAAQYGVEVVVRERAPFSAHSEDTNG